MPCIINPKAAQSKQQGHIWGAYCGKVLLLLNNPFKTPEEAIKSGKPICKKCRALSGLPPKPKT